MRTRNGFLTIAFIFVFLFVTACGGSPSSSTSSSSSAGGSSAGGEGGQQEEGQVTLHFAAVTTFGEDSWWDLIQQFEAENPNIKIKLTQLPSVSKSTEVHQYLVNALHSKGDIDVFTGDVIWVPEFAAAGWTEPMDDYLPDKDEYYPGVIDALTYQGKLMAIPWFVDGGLLYYRKDLLEKYNLPVPQTWQELYDQAKLIMEQENDPNLNGFMWQAKQAEVLVCDFIEFLDSANGAVIDSNENTVINSPETLQALEMMKKFIDDGISPKTILAMDEEPSRTVFTDGNAIFLRNWTYVWNQAQNEEVSKVAGKVGTAPLPAFEGGKSASTMGGYQFMIAKHTEHKEEAVKFARFLSSKEAQTFYAKNGGLSPTRPAVLEDPELKETQPFLADIGKVFEGTAARPVSPKYPQISLQLQANISAYLEGAVTAEQAVEEMEKQIKAILGK